MSARNNVHVPLALNPLKTLKNAERGEFELTTLGSTNRASGCHVPPSGTPVKGMVTN